MLHRVIGIDLGTTYSAVAAFDTDEESATILYDPAVGEAAGSVTPSVIWIDSVRKRAAVGDVAKRMIATEPANTVIEIKRDMGELFTDETLDRLGARPMHKENDALRVPFAGYWLLPQELSALILMRMKAIAESALGGTIHDAVITVPAFFLESQRKATEEAAHLAGMHARQLIAEPTAAAIAYGVDKGDVEPHTYLIYDLGGGTFDVSIIETEAGSINVIATSGDRRLGGGDFDNAVTRWALTQVGLPPETTSPYARQVKEVAERAKRQVSVYLEAELALPPITPGGPPPAPLTLTRELFEKLIDADLRKSLGWVEKALELAATKRDIGREAIDAVLLVGGSTRIPRVRAMLAEYFGREEDFVKADANPDTIVARGAAIVAYGFPPSPRFDLAERPDASLVNPDALDIPRIRHIAEHTLGVGVQDNLVDPLVHQASSIPASQTKDYTNPHNAPKIDCAVFQGEGRTTFENDLIGTIVIGPLEPREAGYHQFRVTFSLDRSGLLTVMVNHLNTGQIYKADFKPTTRVTDEFEVARKRLLGLFDGQPPPTSPSPPAPDTTSLPPPVPPSGRSVDGTPGPAAGPVAAPVTGPGAGEVPAPTAPPASGAGAGGSLGMVELTAELPDEFRQIVRRVKRHLLRGPDAPLLAALNRFTEALNRGADTDDLEDLGDEMADAFDDARRVE